MTFALYIADDETRIKLAAEADGETDYINANAIKVIHRMACFCMI